MLKNPSLQAGFFIFKIVLKMWDCGQKKHGLKADQKYVFLEFNP